MNWLTPIGFIGLSGIAVLIFIYIIKPNYQNKRISSTYLWHRSLKYKKRTVPISKIQNLLTFLAQVLILALLGTLLAGPVTVSGDAGDENEAVIVIDQSASMRITNGTETRYERAVKAAREKAEETFSKGSAVTVILASDDPEVYLSAIPEERDTALKSIEQLLDGDEGCIYSSADIGGAMALAGSVLEGNPAASVYFYTGRDYTYENGVEVVNLSEEGEWNFAVLDARAELDKDNHYAFSVDTACYGRTDFLTLTLEIRGVNGDPSKTLKLEKGEFFDPTCEEKTFTFTSDDMTGYAVYSYDHIEAYTEVQDSLAEDNYFLLFGGRRNRIRIQYASSSPNNFFESALRSLRQNYRESFDIELALLREGESYATEGFDFYIFEHRMPDRLPDDGVVLLVDPDKAPEGSGLSIGSSYRVDASSTLSAGEGHPLTEFVSPSRITVAKYTDIVLADGYRELMFYNGRPVMLLKESEGGAVAVWGFDLNYSNLPAIPDFSFLIHNTFTHFFPKTLDRSSYRVGEKIKLTGRGNSISVVGEETSVSFDGGNGDFIPTRPGTYTVKQAGFGGAELMEEYFFVSIPRDESDPVRTLDGLPFTAPEAQGNIEYRDLIFIFAASLVALMMAEWVLEIKRNY